MSRKIKRLAEQMKRHLDVVQAKNTPPPTFITPEVASEFRQVASGLYRLAERPDPTRIAPSEETHLGTVSAYISLALATFVEVFDDEPSLDQWREAGGADAMAIFLDLRTASRAHGYDYEVSTLVAGADHFHGILSFSAQQNPAAVTVGA